MAYITLNKAHTHHRTTINGQPANQYSRYKTGLITGSKRNLPAILADNTGSDGYGFDSAVGSDDDSWHVLNAFDKRGSYVDTIAVGGAMDSDHALVVAQTQLDSLGVSSFALIGTGLTQFDSLNQQKAGTFSIDAINKLMDNPSQNKNYLPIITTSELAFEAERVTFDSVQWGENSNELLSHDGRDSTLMLDMTRADTRSDLVNEFELADVLDLLGAEPEQSFDALMDTKNRLGLLKDRLYNAMSRASNDTVSITNVTETKPFKRQGVTNIAFVFDLSDGQKLSIWFHNPDSTPSKLMPSDIMISWKWMLNKRDVTAALSPKQGDNVQLPVLASRIMRVAAKNSMRFKRTQARLLKLEQDLLDAQALVDTKVATIEQLDKDIESLTSQIDAAMKAPKIEPVVEPVVEPVMEPSVVDEAVADPAGQDSTTQDDTDVAAPITITGKEIDVSEDVDFKTAKNNAMAYFDNNLKDKVVFCPAIDSDVLLRRRGGKHIAKANHTFREKLKLVAAIPEMIKQGKYGHYTALNKEKGSNIEGYYVLNVAVVVGGNLKAARVVLEKNNEGEVLYDIGIDKKEALAALGDTITKNTFDGFTGSSQYQDFLDESYQADDSDVNQFDNVLETAIPDNDSRVASNTLNITALNNEDVNQAQAMFDKADLATEGVVLNIFILNDTFAEDTASNDDIPDGQTNPNNITTGKTNTSSTVKGTEIKSNFALVEAKSLITSHDASGAVNPSFPQELQPRDRSNTKSVESIKENAKNLQPEKLGDTKFAGNGAPIVGDDLIVESGNGRVIAINTAYQNGSAENYKQWLTDNAQDFGFSSDQVQKYEQPVLVRVRVTEVDRIDFTVEANLDPDYSPDNPYAAYATKDEDAKNNANDWEAREPLTEERLQQLNNLSESLGFSAFIEPRHAGLGVFQATKEAGGRKVEIEGKFKNNDGQTSKEAPRDFTIEKSENSEVVDYQYTNNLVDYIKEANDWLNPKAQDESMESNLAVKVDGIVNEINSSDFDPESFDVDALTAIAEEAEGNSDLTAKLEAASEVYQNKLIAIAMQAMSDMVGN